MMTRDCTAFNGTYMHTVSSVNTCSLFFILKLIYITVCIYDPEKSPKRVITNQ